MVAVADGAGPASCRGSHLDIVGRISDHHGLGRLGAETLKHPPDEVRCRFGPFDAAYASEYLEVLPYPVLLKKLYYTVKPFKIIAALRRLQLMPGKLRKPYHLYAHLFHEPARGGLFQGLAGTGMATAGVGPQARGVVF